MNFARSRVRHLGRGLWAVSAVAALLVAGCSSEPLVREDSVETKSDDGGSRVSSAKAGEALRIQAYLDSRYLRSDVRHEFVGSTGQAVDCVDAAAQPSLKIPELRGHRPILTPPSYLPKVGEPSPSIARPEDGTQDDQGRMRRCPSGTVPILRQTVESIERMGGLDRFMELSGKKAAPPVAQLAPGAPAPTPAGLSAPGAPIVPPHPGSAEARTASASSGNAAPPAPMTYSYAIGVNMQLQSLPNCPSPGGGTRFSVNLPDVLAWDTTKSGSDHSIAQIWLSSPGDPINCTAPNCIQTVEAGWTVDAALNDDGYPHFFIFSTRDGYKNTGCYNLATNCQGTAGPATGSGFVLTSNPPLIPGWLLFPQTTPELNVYWYKSPSREWWLWANGWIGYIPETLFGNGNGGNAPLGGPDTSHNYYATYFQSGGEVANTVYPLDTTSDMGSGEWPNLGASSAAYGRNAVVTCRDNDPDASDYDVNAPLQSYFNNPSNYSTDFAPAPGGSGWGSYFYFGGPGLPASAPAVPAGLTVDPYNGEVHLKWFAVPDAITYQVHYSTTPGTPSSWEFGGISQNDWWIDGLTVGGTYYFNVRAINEAGTSAWSTQVSAIASLPTAPATPMGLATQGGIQQIKLTWNPVGNATSYTVKSATSATGSLGNAHSGITGNTYTYTSLSNGKNYWFVVSAQNAQGSSADSPRVSGITAPAAPSGVSATATTGKITVSWSAPTSATKYKVFRSTSSGSVGSAIATDITSTSYADTSLNKGTKYYYRVAAGNAAGYGSNSSQVSATAK